MCSWVLQCSEKADLEIGKGILPLQLPIDNF